MQQYLTYICTDINETGPSLVIFLRVDQFYVLRFLFCRVYFTARSNLVAYAFKLGKLLQSYSIGKTAADDKIDRKNDPRGLSAPAMGL